MLIDTYELAQQLSDIRADVQLLTATVGRLTGNQWRQAQDAAMESVNEVDEAIRRNPLSAMAIAAGTGLLLGVLLSRR
jgi:ElaB/YqjD/DUF883 family membrane-anchored ribosome-binding protein